MTDDPVTVCETCGAPVQRVFHPVAVHFKGSGFYNTDYGKRGAARRAQRRSSDSTRIERGEERGRPRARTPFLGEDHLVLLD